MMNVLASVAKAIPVDTVPESIVVAGYLIAIAIVVAAIIHASIR